MPRLLLFCAILTSAALPLAAAGSDETFYAGLGAYRGGAYASALTLLGRTTDNPYLEVFRLFYRADCLLRDSLSMDAAAALESIFTLVDSGAVGKNHRFVKRAYDKHIEALASGGICVIEPRKIFPSSGTHGPSNRAWFIASRACFAAGDTASALRHFAQAATGSMAAEDSPLFKELFHRYEPCFDACSDRELMSIASRAAEFGMFPEANTAVDRALARNPGDPRALLGKANVMFQSGELERALRAYWRVFDSAAPVSEKSSALGRIASIEYRLKRYDKAAKHYFMHGTFYRAASSLDMAARIYVMQGEWKKALAAWNTLRERHRGDGLHSDVQVWIEAGLSEAVLRSWRGNNAKANEILRDIMPRARGTLSASALYWLMKTSATDAERRAWSDSLARAWPRSFYAAIARGDEAFLSDGSDGSGAWEIDALARIAGDRLARCDTAGVDSAFARHPGYLAFAALLDHGFGDEAAAVAHAMVGIEDLLFRPTEQDESANHKERMRFRPVPGRLSKLYSESVRRGFGSLSMTLLSSTRPTDSTGAFPADLWYPVMYLDEIRAGAASAGLSPFLVLGIIREESRFDPAAVSRAGAIGLMQLMPATASWHSGARGAVPPSEDDLRNPSKNIRAGIEYFRYLLGRSGGSVIAALASYNGGHGRMARWRDNFRPAENPLVALELIGPRETRAYVKKVLDARSAYAAIAGEKAGAE